MNKQKLKGVLTNWLSETEDVDIVPIGKGATNSFYQITKGSDIVFLKEYKYSDIQFVVREHNLLEELRLTKIPANKLIQTNSKGTYFNDNEKYYALYEAVEGEQLEQYELTELHAVSIAKTLANLHKVLGNFEDRGYTKWNLNWDGNAWANRLDKVLSRISDIEELSSTDEWALERAKAQQAWLRNPMCMHEYTYLNPSQVIHGDFHHHNLFFDKKGVVSGIIDWDQASYMPRAYELLRACSFMFQTDITPSLVFLNSYLEVHPLTLEELEDGARAWGCFSDHHVWPLEETYLNQNQAAIKFIPNKPFTPFGDFWAEVLKGLSV